MKYLVLIGDGMADRPLKELNGRTPLEAARTPNMDNLAKQGTVGMANTLPEGLPTGSDVANLSILGYDPRKYYTGRAPLEAINMGIELAAGDVAFRCNLVTLEFAPGGKTVMVDHSAGQLGTEEGHSLIKSLQKELGTSSVKFYPGVSYRNVTIWSDGERKTDCTPPHDILGKDISGYLPKGPGSEFIQELMLKSVGILENHPVNQARVAKGQRPANSIWLWGQGGRPGLPPFREIYGLEGGMISAVDLTNGLGRAAGLEVIKVPGATGYLDTNYKGKAEYAVRALKGGLDFVYVHVEASDEASHEGVLADKITAIENFDNLIVGTVLKEAAAIRDLKILVMPDHPTPLELRTHARDAVPFIIHDSRKNGKGSGVGYNERISTLEGIVKIQDAYKLMKFFTKGELD